MENCLAKNPDINVVYTINEPAAVGANEALKAAGSPTASSSSRSTAAAPASQQVKDGVIGATSQQYPLKMAELGVEAIADDRRAVARSRRDHRGPRLLRHRRRPRDRQAGRRASTASTPTEAAEICWG